MKRRNVLGNQIEASKTLWIVLAGMLVAILQFVIYHFIGDGWLGLLLVGLCSLLGAVAVHAVTEELEELFSYLMIPCILSGCLGIIFSKVEGEFLPQSSTVFLGGLLAWLIPVLYACIFTWVEGNTMLLQFTVFYKKATVFFYLIYAAVLVYWFVVYSRVPEAEITARFIPFGTFAAYVDGVLSGKVLLVRLVMFLAERILLALPYGFLLAMTGRKLHGLIRLGLLLFVPVLVEILQYLMDFNSFDADDIVFAFLGGLLGVIGFVLFNHMFQKTTGKNFDGSEVERDYYGRRI